MSKITLENNDSIPMTPVTNRMAIYGINDHLYLKDDSGASRQLDWTGQEAFTTADLSASATTVYLNNVPNTPATSMWMVVDAYTSNAELRRITSKTANSIVVTPGLTYTHSAGATVLLLDTAFINVKWFGAVGDGTTNDSPAFQRALDQRLNYAGRNYGLTIFVPSATYRLNTALDMCLRFDINLVGESSAGTILDFHCTGKACIQIVGSQRITIQNLRVYGDLTDTPMVGILTARAVADLNSSLITFEHVSVWGDFTSACWLNIGSESNSWRHCDTWMTTTNCNYGIAFDYRNEIGVTCDFTTMSVATYDTWKPIIERSYIICGGSATNFIPFYIRAGGGPTVRDTYVIAYGQPNFYLKGGGTLDLLNTASEGATYTVYVTHDTTYEVPGATSTIVMDGVYAPGSSGYSVWFDDLTNARSCFIRNTFCTAGIRFYQLETSVIDKWTIFQNYPTYTITIAQSVANSKIFIDYKHEISLPTGNVYNTIIEYKKDIFAGETRFYKNALVIGRHEDRLLEARTERVMTKLVEWNPGTVANDTVVYTTVSLSGVLSDGNWVCEASLSSITDAGWFISAIAISSNVRVSLYNRTGGSKTPGNGILRVVATMYGQHQTKYVLLKTESIAVGEAVTVSIV